MAHEVARPTTREWLSFSQLKLSATCGEAYRRRYVEDESVGALTVPAVAGQAFHQAMVGFESGLRLLRDNGQWETLTSEKAAGTLNSIVRHQTNEILREKGITSEDLFHYGKQPLGHYLKEKFPAWSQKYVVWRLMEEHERNFRWGVDDDPTKSIEIEALVEVAGHPFLSFIDQVFLDSRGLLVIRDLKTGNPAPGDAFQLEQYRVALKRSMGLEAAYGQLLYVGRGEEAKPQVVPFRLTDNEVDRLTGRLLRSTDEHLFLINGPMNGACKNCEFRPDCPWGQVGVHGSS